MFTPIVVDNVFECQPHPWHPSVMYVPEGWNGHRYWMAQTPFPPCEVKPYRDRYELPCIHFSDDGKLWHTVATNPIDELDEKAIDEHNYFSDPHLVLKDGVLECYYRFSILNDRQLVGNKTLLFKKISMDGAQWSERIVVADLRSDDDVAIWGDQIISQSVVWTGNEYLCWYVDASSYVPLRHVNLVTSKDGMHWKRFEQCTLDGKNINPWHIDVQYVDDKFIMLCYSSDSDCIYCLVSYDGLHFRWISDVIAASRQKYDFFRDGVYRACLVKINDVFRVYFSAKRGGQSSIGLLESTDLRTFLFVNCQNSLRYWGWKKYFGYAFSRIKRFIVK